MRTSVYPASQAVRTPAVTAMVLAAGLLVALGSVLALAEASLSRVNRVRALKLAAEGRPHAEALVRIESDPTAYLNAIYLAVVFVQNGSAILVAILADQVYGSTGITIVSILFTILYFVLVEAFSKTVGVLHSDRVALAVSPFVVGLAWILHVPTRLLVGLAGLFVPKAPGDGVSEDDIRSMADIGMQEGGIDSREREMIHSVFRIGDTVVREVMTPRPDIAALPATAGTDEARALFRSSGYTRVPVYTDRLDDAIGFLHAKDLLHAVPGDGAQPSIKELLHPLRFVPESRLVTDVLKEMQRDRVHLCLIVDEFGTVSGLVTLEDLLEELVGEIEDEHDREHPAIEEIEAGRWRIDGRLSIDRLNEALGASFPNQDWDTVGGLVMGTLGRPPKTGDAVDLDGFRVIAEKVSRRRVRQALVERLLPEDARS